MGEALIKGFLQTKLLLPQQIIVSRRHQEKLAGLKRRYGIKTAKSNREAVKEAEIVILAVKPGNLKEVLTEIAPFLKDQTLVSLVAGFSTSRILKILGKKAALVRIMPNSSILVQGGISVLSPSRFISKRKISEVAKLFLSVGGVVYLEESQQNKATALSGSGPAYFYYFGESLIEAGMKLGLTQKMARRLVVETLNGASKMLKETGKSPKTLRKMVTTPGGTTAAALKIFEKGKLKMQVYEAVRAANRRAGELG